MSYRSPQHIGNITINGEKNNLYSLYKDNIEDIVFEYYYTMKDGSIKYLDEYINGELSKYERKRQSYMKYEVLLDPLRITIIENEDKRQLYNCVAYRSFLCYYKQKLELEGYDNLSNIIRMIGRKWGSLSNNEKIVYMNSAIKYVDDRNLKSDRDFKSMKYTDEYFSNYPELSFSS